MGVAQTTAAGPGLVRCNAGVTGNARFAGDVRNARWSRTVRTGRSVAARARRAVTVAVSCSARPSAAAGTSNVSRSAVTARHPLLYLSPDAARRPAPSTGASRRCRRRARSSPLRRCGSLRGWSSTRKGGRPRSRASRLPVPGKAGTTGTGPRFPAARCLAGVLIPAVCTRYPPIV
jgi:hypothetical protein